MMSRKMMFVNAHRITKQIVDSADDYAIAFEFALKFVWGKVKAGMKRMSQSAQRNAVYTLTHKQYTGPSFFWIGHKGVPDWLMEENLTQSENDGAHLAYSIRVARETAKAFLLTFVTDYGDIEMWAPRSVVKGF